MPIYAYKCASCGFSQDEMQRISDSPLTVCPSCGEAGYAKQVTAPGFALKGTGWYATDFKGSGGKPAETPPKAETSPKAETTPKAETPSPAATTSTIPAP